MPPAVTKANYKTYESQARLVRAIVAAHPEVKWNYKEISACYGSDMTEHALNHRFRPLRAEAVIISEARKRGLDMKDMKLGEVLPATQGAVDTKNIAKYFGQSTADGIGFQFRSIKKDAEKLRKVETEGGDVASALLGDIGTASSSTVVTPSKPTASRGTASTGKRPRARNATVTSKKEVSSDSDGIEEIPNFSELDEPSPTKRPRPAPPVRALSQNNNHHTLQPLPSRQRSAGPSEEVHGESSASSMDVLTPSSPAPSASAAPASASAATPRPGKSLFGPVPSKTQTPKRQEATVPSNAFRANAVDAYVGSQGQDPSASYNSASSAYSTGEI